MLKNYVTLAWRSLAKYPVYTGLNLGGLALGIAAAFVLGLYVNQELTYDRHFDDSERIYRVATDFFDMGGFALSQEQLLDVLPDEAATVEQGTRVAGQGSTLIFVGEDRYEESSVLLADSVFFQMFSFDFASGDPASALLAPDGAVLSEELARRYFGEEPAMGQTLLVGKERVPHRVTGVVAASRGKTHLDANLWLPLERDEPRPNWTNVTYYNYVKLRPGAAQADLEKGLETIRRRHAYPTSGFDGTFEEWAAMPWAVQFWAQPLHDIHLHSAFNFERPPSGDPLQVYALGVIGLFVLLIAGVNYVNLTTARSTVRAKEVGVKKALGVARHSLVGQFLTETVVFSLLAAVLAGILAEGMLAAFAFITGTPLVESVLTGGGYALVLIAFALGVGVLAGLYPAFYLARFRPAQILKGGETGSGNHGLRGALVVGQFAVAIALVVGSLTVYQQLAFMQETDKGLSPDGVMVVENARALGEQLGAFQQEVDRLTGVERTSLTRRVPAGNAISMGSFVAPNLEEPLPIQIFRADEDYLPTLGLRLLAGRNFRDTAADSSALILNEAAVAALGLGDDPIGQTVNESDLVVGVVSDFQFQSLRGRIEPAVLRYGTDGDVLAIRLHGGGEVAASLDQVQALWQTFAPDDPIRTSFLDDNFAALAEQERTLGKAVAFFTLLALVIAAMGLFGLVAFAVQRRTKEIGIRKVLGAGVPAILTLLSKEFLRLVAFGFALAVPVAWFVMSRWLDGFAYRIEIGPGLFLAAGGLALLIALATVSAQALRAATADPVRALRHE